MDFERPGAQAHGDQVLPAFARWLSDGRFSYRTEAPVTVLATSMPEVVFCPPPNNLFNSISYIYASSVARMARADSTPGRAGVLTAERIRHNLIAADDTRV